MTMQRITTIRHDALIPPPLRTLPIHLIGCGGVGSHVAMMLAKMQVGTGLWLYDDDVIEPQNPPNQAFGPEHIGQPKVEALLSQVRGWSDGTLWCATHQSRITTLYTLSGIVFLCVDSMEARKTIMESSILGNPAISLVVETRMDAKLAMAFIFDPNQAVHQKLWKRSWYPDAVTESIAGCGGHLSVITAVMQTAVVAVQGAMNHFHAPTEAANHVQLNLETWKLTTRTWPLSLDE